VEETNAKRLDLRLAVAAVSLLVILAIPVVALTGLIDYSEGSISELAPAPKTHAVLEVASAEVPPFGPRLVHVVGNEAFPPPLPVGMAYEPDQMFKLRALSLTEAQQDQIFEIFHEQASAMHAQLKQVRRSREELRKLAIADRFDEGRARQMADAQGKALAALAVMRAQTMSRVRQILTPEQRAKMDQFVDRRGAGVGYGVGVKN
jgi:Spy/CpxP family protein refolding chaperone